MLKSIRVFLVLISLLIMASCQKRKEETEIRVVDQLENNIYNQHKNPEFKTTSLHGEVYLKTKKEKSCQVCHGTDFLGGNTKKSCKRCHDFPHPKNWMEDKSLHGIKFDQIYHTKKDKQGNEARCIDCHGKDNERNCGKCHKLAMPHSKQFKNVHHHGVHGRLATKYLKECKICHMKKDLARPHNMDKINRFLDATKIKYPKVEKCAECHQEIGLTQDQLSEIIKNKIVVDDLKNPEKMNGMKNKIKHCNVCHKIKMKPVNLETRKKYLSSCAACHRPNKEAIQKFKEDNEGNKVPYIEYY